MVARSVHTCELEEVDGWTLGAGYSISTPEVSFRKLSQLCCVSHGYLGLLLVRLLLQFPAMTSDMCIIVVVETLRASLGITIRKVAASLHLHVLDVNVHGGCSLVLRASRSIVEGAIVVGSQITYKLQCVG